jgi:hypothetical protein
VDMVGEDCTPEQVDGRTTACARNGVLHIRHGCLVEATYPSPSVPRDVSVELIGAMAWHGSGFASGPRLTPGASPGNTTLAPEQKDLASELCGESQNHA